MSTAKQVFEAAVALSAEAREELASALSISLEAATSTPAWQEEIENGEAGGMLWSEGRVAVREAR